MSYSETFGLFWVLLAEKDFDQLDNLDVQDQGGGHSEELIVGLVVHFQPLVDSVNRCKLQLRLSELARHTCNTKPLFCQKTTSVRAYIAVSPHSCEFSDLTMC